MVTAAYITGGAPEGGCYPASALPWDSSSRYLVTRVQAPHAPYCPALQPGMVREDGGGGKETGGNQVESESWEQAVE